LAFQTDRASVRRWAIAHHLNPDTRYKRPPKPVKRWQVRDAGALWQYDATPHAWFPGRPDKQVLLDLLDDATRYNTGARLYPSETLLAHLDFLDRAFQAHGLPLALRVDYHSFFYTHNPDAFTQLGQALHFYGVAFRYAPTPQAKGNIERRHDYWQKRLPPLLAADQIHDLPTANQLLDQLLPPLLKMRTAGRSERAVDAQTKRSQTQIMSITLEFDEQALASLPLGPGERERHMQIELACRYYARGWLSLAQGARLAALDLYAFGVELGERNIPRQYGLKEAQEDIAHAGGQ
jgi:predicted HTH domain antitoxin